MVVVAAGGVANIVEGNTNVTILGGEVSNMAPDTNGGNVYGGGYSRNQNVGGNTNVTIGGDAYILQSVYGGGRYFITQGANTVFGNSTVNIEGGQINGNIYAGAQILSVVEGNSTINLSNINQDNIFSNTFEQSLYRGNRNGTSIVNFNNYNSYFKGNIGDQSNSNYLGTFDQVNVDENSHVKLIGGKKYYSNIWEIQPAGEVSILSNTTLNNYTGTTQVINLGEISLNDEDSLQNTILTVQGNYLSGSDHNSVNLYANTNLDKNYIVISQNADIGNTPTTINLNLDYYWDHTRIDLIEADQTSNIGTFIMDDIPVQGGYAVLKYEQTEDRTIWYIEFQENNNIPIIIIVIILLLSLIICSISLYCQCCNCCKCCKKNKFINHK